MRRFLLTAVTLKDNKNPSRLSQILDLDMRIKQGSLFHTKTLQTLKLQPPYIPSHNCIPFVLLQKCAALFTRGASSSWKLP